MHEDLAKQEGRKLMKTKLSLVIKTLIIKSCMILMIVGMTDSAAFSQTRIRFAPGRSSATVSGSLASRGTRSYILNASAGQSMTVRVKSGNVWVDIGGNDVGKGVTIELRSTDSYIITVHNAGNGTTKYSLYIGIS